jgi:hypothetical protein
MVDDVVRENQSFPLTYLEAVGRHLMGQPVQIFYDTNAGTNNYSDFDVNQKCVLRGTLVGVSGNMLTVRCEVFTGERSYITDVHLSGWGIIGISSGEEVPIEHVFAMRDNMRRKR